MSALSVPAIGIMDMNEQVSRPITAAIWGCGAVSELYYAPALRRLGGLFSVVALHDPDESRARGLQAVFDGARLVKSLGELPANTELLIIASPPAFHVEQAVAALNAGMNVLCEKPIATSAASAKAIVQAAESSGKLAAAGLFRRFFPASKIMNQLIGSRTFGEVTGFDFQEGDRFVWESRSNALFQRDTACGGVLADIGSHVLDLLTWWLGRVELESYADDCMGGVESNCLIRLVAQNDVRGTVRLSRDCRLSNRFTVICKDGSISWVVGQANGLELTLADGTVLESDLMKSGHYLAGDRQPLDDYSQSFRAQLMNVAQSIRGKAQLEVPVASTLAGIELVEHCYRNRQLIAMPWLNQAEQDEACRLNQSRVAS